MHAFVDESERPGRYLMCAVLVAPRDLTTVRRALTALCLPGQRRLHMAKERKPRRHLILDRMAALPLRARMYVEPGPAFQARSSCLRSIVRDISELDITRLVIEPVDGYLQHDRSTIINEVQRLGRGQALDYEHLAARFEPVLWAADGIAWAYGAGDDWRRRIKSCLDN